MGGGRKWRAESRPLTKSLARLGSGSLLLLGRRDGSQHRLLLALPNQKPSRTPGKLFAESSPALSSKVKVLFAQSCLTLCNLMRCSPPGSSVHADSAAKSTGVGCHFLLQGNFPTQRLNPGPLHCRQIPDHLSHREVQLIHSSAYCWGSFGLFLTKKPDLSTWETVGTSITWAEGLARSSAGLQRQASDPVGAVWCTNQPG